MDWTPRSTPLFPPHGKETGWSHPWLWHSVVPVFDDLEDVSFLSLAASGGTDRSAHFICALVLCWPDGHEEGFEGRIDGSLVWPPRGDRGFGYDPIFVARGHDLTFGEMEPQEKLDIGHRADAFAKLVAACFP